MLTDQEREGCKEMLKSLEKSTLQSLVATITNQQIKTQTVEESVNAILTFTVKPVDLLRRQKIKKSNLFNYIAQNHLHVDPKGTKLAYINTILQYWGSAQVREEDLMEVHFQDQLPMRPSHAPAPAHAFAPPSPAASSPQQTPVIVNLTLNNMMHSTTSNVVQPPPMSGIVQPPPMSGMVQPTQMPGAFQLPPAEPNHLLMASQAGPSQDLEMAVQFAGWFYSMLNSHHPAVPQEPDHTYGEAHFYRDCQMRVCTLPERTIEMLQGADAVSQKLLSYIVSDGILFQPHLEPSGIKSMTEPHGVKKIMVCGTVHKDGAVVGIFEQQFGLIQDPTMQDNWRVKMTDLKLGVGEITRVPTLEDTSKVLAIE